MGLAASQARFLNLTARKTNIEYEGQQINQQRTTLANESANYYNQMLTLSVPVPPSESAYQTVVYTFSYNNQTYNVNQITGSAQGGYTVSYTTSYTENEMAKSTNIYTISKDADGNYTYAGKTIKTINSKDENNEDYFDDTTQKNIVANMKSTSGKSDLDETKVYFVNVGTTAAPNYVYFTSSDLETASESATDSTAQGYAYTDITKYQNGALTKTTITRDANNRIAAITSDDIANGQSISVTAATVTDNTAYEDAYNEYTYKTYLYQQQMEEINAQTSIIQAQDKKLELRLKQLDTEQSAISTEMESISSVIDKNVDDSFKVFA